MKPSKEKKQEMIDRLSFPWGRVELLCDGYRIALRVQQISPLKFRVVTYVNGVWEGKWMIGTETFPSRSF